VLVLGRPAWRLWLPPHDPTSWELEYIPADRERLHPGAVLGTHDVPHRLRVEAPHGPEVADSAAIAAGSLRTAYWRIAPPPILLAAYATRDPIRVGFPDPSGHDTGGGCHVHGGLSPEYPDPLQPILFTKDFVSQFIYYNSGLHGGYVISPGAAHA
jgi:hypothetical protein